LHPESQWRFWYGSASVSGSASASWSVSQRYRAEDPNPLQHVTDPKHCHQHYNAKWCLL